MCEFTKVINIGNKRSYLYDANINKVVLLPEYISDDSFRFTAEYLRKKMDLYKNLLKQGFFRGKRLDRIENPEVKNVDTVLDKGIERLILQVTQGCNLACSYCFFSEQYHHKKECVMMNWEIAKRGIDYYIQHAEAVKELKFNFYGGEPLLNFELIKKCVEYIEKRISDRKCQFSITTNLTLLNEEMADFLEKYHFLILVSLDGPQDIHDRNRKYKDGNDTYKTVISNLQYMKDRHPDFFNTITFNAVLTNQEDYINIKNYFLREHPVISGNDFIISPLYLGIDQRQFASPKRERKIRAREYIDQIKENIQRCKELVLSYLLAFEIIQVDFQNEERYTDIELTNWLKNFIFLTSNNALSLSDLGHPSGSCIGGSSRLMLDPEGKFWPCEKINTNNDELSIGDVFRGIQGEKVKKMLNFSKGNEPCYQCWAFRFCGLCVAAVHNASREVACKCSMDYFESRLFQYCNIQHINDRYINISKSSECGWEEISRYLLEEENIDIEYFDYGENVSENSFMLYKILIIIKYKFGLNFSAGDIINYKNLKSFIKNQCSND